MNHVPIYKIIIIGDPGVGKSSFMLRFTDNKFDERYVSTIGVDFKNKLIEVDDKIITLQLWDTAGQDRFKSITTSYYRGADSVLIMFDLTDRTSFKNVTQWMDEVGRYRTHSVYIILAGSKCDLTDRVVTKDEAEQLAAKYNILYFETSAKKYINVNTVFEEIAQELVNREYNRRKTTATANPSGQIIREDEEEDTDGAMIDAISQKITKGIKKGFKLTKQTIQQSSCFCSSSN